MTSPVWMVDTTLRDGEQTPGVVFRPLEKLEIAWALAACGIDEIEAGIPAMGKLACQEILALSSLGLPCMLSCWCRALKEDIRLAADCGTPGVHLSFPTSSILLKTFDKTEGWALDTLEDLVSYSKQYFDQVSVGAQDATRTDTGFLERFATRCLELGVHRLRLADTVGMASPSRVMEMVQGLGRAVPGLSLEFHGHNDLGMATANAVCAVEAGARALSVTVNGLGERAGNTALEEVAMALDGLGPERGRIRLSGLFALCRMVSQYSGQKIHPAKPIVGSRVFSHESGIHCAGLLKDPRSFQPFDPATVGVKGSSLVLGSHSGTALVCHVLKQQGIVIDKKCAQALLEKIRKEATCFNLALTEERLVDLYRHLVSETDHSMA